MIQFVQVVSIAMVFGVSLLPAGGHKPVTAPPGLSVAVSDLGLASQAESRPHVRLEELSVKAYDAIVAQAEAEAAAKAAAEAKAKAEAEAAKAKAEAEAAALAASQAAAARNARPNPPVAPAPAVAPAASGSVPDMIRTAFGPQGPAAVEWGLRIAKCESGYNPAAHNPSGASGVFQFMPGTFRGTPFGGGNIFDAWTNVQAAAWYYQRYGGGAWVCS